jgi:hypothetical protein
VKKANKAAVERAEIKRYFRLYDELRLGWVGGFRERIEFDSLAVCNRLGDIGFTIAV